jgi:LacI family transcriptional regulator
MPPTLEEVAALANVSRSTVSRVINNQPNVHAKTKEKVWQAIRKSGYQPNVVARSLVTRRTRIIGVIIPEAVTSLFTDPFFPLLLCGATEACNAHHYQLMLSLFTVGTDSAEMYRRVVRNGYLDGAIVASTSLDASLIPDLLRDNIPFVSVGRHPDERVHYVDVDNAGGAQMAVEHLIRQGHQRIATITGRLDIVSAQDRLSGYRQALEAQGMPVREELIVNGNYTEPSGLAGMQKLLKAEPTAVFVASDTMAAGALKALRAADLRVPQDIALVGFDDTPIASLVEPGLTTVRQPIQQLGLTAVEMLFERIEDLEEEPPARRLVLPTEMVIRGSCGST